ncbi:MAG TPA: signal peptide peptidase SppA [Desulfobacteraceae bacterium]|nr:signal peptide peptidase SppA [Desulfobacteraceae bacterium]HPJ67007.1 signal peptide peptidase SppA [Desulfobacteraceae bacterium]HPQ27273.1 signal peptide peptidase SppA [Desulfobacteraceae bacterium]
MAGKKHPILTVLIILTGIAIVLGVVMFVISGISATSSKFSFKEKVGVISIEGTISQSRKITSQLAKFRKDNQIKAIVLRIDSPGGQVGPTQEIFREIQKIVQSKKVIASLGSVAASGGYYIAAAADKIVAAPGTITGSIGVIMQFIRIEDLLKKIGIDFETLKSGEFKDIGSPGRELTERDREILNAVIQDIQRQFVEGVAIGRNLDLEKVREIADGRIFSGAQARELGLVDELGNFEDAVEIAKELAGIKGEVTLVYPEKDTLDLWNLFLDATGKSLIKLLQNIKPQVEYRWKMELLGGQ